MRLEQPKHPVVTFFRVYEDAPQPLRGDKSALGSLPAAALQYCEAVRTASSYGWYIFPPRDIRLKWDGVDVFYSLDGAWDKLSSIALNNEFVEHWEQNAPEHLKKYWPPFMSSLFVPGIVQIWSGLLVTTSENWSMMIGPPSNIAHTRSYSCFEGIVETDVFGPCPLFVNIRLQETDREILIPRDRPLFQARPVRRDAYAEGAMWFKEHVGLAPREDGSDAMSPDDWAGYERTVRKKDAPAESHTPGAYGASRRRDAKRALE